MTRLGSTFFVMLALAASLTGCGGSPGAPDNQPPAPVGLLRAAASDAELFDSLTEGFTQVSDDQVAPLGATPVLARAEADGGFSTTYTQESGVDEFDIVKYDGEFMYLAPTQGHLDCCFIAAEPAAAIDAPAPPAREPTIRVLRMDLSAGDAAQVSSIDVDESVSVQGLYLDGDRLVAVSTGSFHGSYGRLWARPDILAEQTTTLTIYDVADPSAPQVAWEGKLQGSFVYSRRVGDDVFLVTRHAPAVEGLQPHVVTEEQADANAQVLERLALGDLLPRMEVDGVADPLVDANDCYLPTEATETGYPVLTTVTVIPLDAPDQHESICYSDDAYGAYVSPEALYLTQLRWESTPQGDQTGTRIHKFGFTAGAVRYAGSGDVEGMLWSGGQADFRANEYNGDLRVLTSEFVHGGEDSVDHHLFVLRENPATLSLDVIGQLPNDERPKEIGKPNEFLYGVRFLGERAFAVTFEQIDPLYGIDLSDPEDPKLAGALEITGFSDLLHPVTDDLLLGLGQSQSGAVKLELFDVSDLADPRSVGQHVLGGRGTRSEANWDRHAFTYLQMDESPDRIAIPAEVYADDDTYTWLESGLYLFEVRDKNVPALATLANVGSLITEVRSEEVAWPMGAQSRSVIHNDTVYFVQQDSVWSTVWGQFGVANGPF